MRADEASQALRAECAKERPSLERARHWLRLGADPLWKPSPSEPGLIQWILRKARPGAPTLELMEAMAAAGAPLDPSESESGSALATAVEDGEIQTALALLRLGASPRARDDRGRGLCAIAIEREDASMLEALLAAGVSACEDGIRGEPPLRQAAAALDEQAALAMCQALLRAGASPRQEGADGWRALHAAARAGNVEVVRLLIEQGDDPAETGSGGVDPIAAALGARWMWRPSPGGSRVDERCVRAALAMGEKMGGRWGSRLDQRGRSPLSRLAAETRRFDQQLFERMERGGADPRALDEGDRNLMWAVALIHSQTQAIRMIEWLAERGVQASQPDREGRLCASLAREGGRLDLAAALEARAEKELLERQGRGESGRSGAKRL